MRIRFDSQLGGRFADLDVAADEADIPLDQTLEQKYSLTGRLKEMIMYAAALSLSDQGMLSILAMQCRLDTD